VDSRRKVVIIAECGINHCGDVKRAVEMAKKAKAAGADIAKFQFYNVADLARPGDDVYDVLKDSGLSYESMLTLSKECRDIGIEFLATLFTPRHFDAFTQIQKRFKIRHTDAFNHEMLLAAFEVAIHMKDSEILLSLPHTELSIPRFVAPVPVKILYCVGKYPPTRDDIELDRLLTQSYHGFSCHYPDTMVVIQACTNLIANAADGDTRYLEVHVMDDLEPRGVDAPVSFTFDQLTEIVREVRELERFES